MLLQGVINKSKPYIALWNKFTLPRALSSKVEISPNISQTVPEPKGRRFLKPQIPRELKTFDANFVVNLFKGECNKEIFEYPLMLGEDEIQTVISHSGEIENFLKSNSIIEINKNTLKDFNKLELFGLSIPQKYGGAGYSATETKFLIECCGVNPSVGRFLGYCDDAGSRLISKFGTEEQKQKYLPRLASGESHITLAYLESGPLIDFKSFEGSVILDYERNGFVINAHKKWVHCAHIADLFLVFLKSSIVHEDNEEFSRVGLDFFIVDKTTPGISVHQLKSGLSKDFDLYEVNFKNVFIPRENQLGNDPIIGYLKLQNVLTHRELTDAVLCSTLIKKMIHSALQYCERTIMNQMHLKDFEYVQINMAYLSAYAYALESVVYLINTRFDSYIEPNLFHEGILAKVFAVDMLQLAVQKYVQILGQSSFKKDEVLDQALKTLHYCSVFDENNTYLKLILSTAGVMHVKPSMAALVKKLRQSFNYPVETIKYKLSLSLKPEKILKNTPKLGLKGELNGVLADEGDLLENCLTKLKLSIEDHLIRYGGTSLENEFALAKYAEMAAYIYALAACLSRASTIFCYNFSNCSKEVDMARLFADIVEAKFEQLASEALHLVDNSIYYKEVGKLAFANKEYPAEHPLSRTY